jgi:hypothetical protein
MHLYDFLDNLWNLYNSLDSLYNRNYFFNNSINRLISNFNMISNIRCWYIFNSLYDFLYYLLYLYHFYNLLFQRNDLLYDYLNWNWRSRNWLLNLYNLLLYQFNVPILRNINDLLLWHINYLLRTRY